MFIRNRNIFCQTWSTDLLLHITCRYADIIVHRLLAVIIEADRTYPELLDSKKLAELSQHINYRHKMAQYAGRESSVITAIVSTVLSSFHSSQRIKLEVRCKFSDLQCKWVNFFYTGEDAFQSWWWLTEWHCCTLKNGHHLINHLLIIRWILSLTSPPPVIM